MSSEIKTLKRFVTRGYIRLTKRDDDYVVTRIVKHIDNKFKVSWFHLELTLCRSFKESFPHSDGTHMIQQFNIDKRWLTPQRRESLDEFLSKKELNAAK